MGDITGKLAPGDLVDIYKKYLRTPPNSWKVIPIGEKSIEYVVAGINFNLEFKEDGWRYHLIVGRNGDEGKELWGEVPYRGPREPNMEHLFKDNMRFARREILGIDCDED